MGNKQKKIKYAFLDTILLDQEAECLKFIQQHPELVSIPLYANATNPICRASWLGHRNIILLLLKHGASLEQTSSDGRTPLIWASAKGNTRTMQVLIEQGANLRHEDNEQVNCFDICVIKSLYKAALYLYQDHGMRPKDPEFYRERVVSKHFDFDLFFKYLAEGRPDADHQDFFEKARREYEEFHSKDLVVDVRESWGDVFARIRDF